LSGSITGLTNIQTYSWQPQNDIDCPEGPNVFQCLEPTVEPRDTTTYTLTAIDENNCQYQDTARVIVIIEPYIYTPNAFSPNNDEMNDEFKLITRKVDGFKLQIYNRCGEKIFQSTDPENGWDGTYKGEKMPPGTYVYVANLRYSNGKRDVLKGSVTLIR
jgi:gliding motility-associated-like protein